MIYFQGRERQGFESWRAETPYFFLHQIITLHLGSSSPDGVCIVTVIKNE